MIASSLLTLFLGWLNYSLSLAEQLKTCKCVQAEGLPRASRYWAAMCRARQRDATTYPIAVERREDGLADSDMASGQAGGGGGRPLSVMGLGGACLLGRDAQDCLPAPRQVRLREPAVHLFSQTRVFARDRTLCLSLTLPSFSLSLSLSPSLPPSLPLSFSPFPLTPSVKHLVANPLAQMSQILHRSENVPTKRLIANAITRMCFACASVHVCQCARER